MAEALRWSQTVIDLADRDPTNANVLVGSPLAVALVFRGVARWRLGRGGWREDFDCAVSMARKIDPVSHAIVIGYKYFSAISDGVLQADDFTLAEIEEALQITERSSDDFARAMSGWRWARAGPSRFLRQTSTRTGGARRAPRHVRQEALRLNAVPSLEAFAAHARAAGGDLDGAIVQLRRAADDAFPNGNFATAEGVTFWLVEKLLPRGAEGDVARPRPRPRGWPPPCPTLAVHTARWWRCACTLW